MRSLVYSGYTQAELDAQYDNPKACPSHNDIMGEVRALSKRARADVAVPDLRWGEDGRECLDIYGDVHATSRPVVVFVHGGAWVSLDKEASAFAAPAFTKAGALFVALGFHTAATVNFSHMVARVRHGIGWLVNHIHHFGGDPERIVLVGHSSGTHLVSQCLTQDWGNLGVRSNPFAGAVLISGLCDLEPVRLSYRNVRLALSKEQVLDFSLKHQAVRVSCPVDVVVAEHDTVEFRRQGEEMARYLKAHALLRNTYTVKKKNHFDIMLDLANPETQLYRSVLSLAFPVRG